MNDEPREPPPNEKEQPPYELDPPKTALVGCLGTMVVMLFALLLVVGRRR
jgi:hypothetical protein